MSFDEKLHHVGIESNSIGSRKHEEVAGSRPWLLRCSGEKKGEVTYMIGTTDFTSIEG